MKRRNFIQASLLGLSGLSTMAMSLNMAKYRMGLQLFSIRGPLSQDPKGTLKKVAALGFQDTENIRLRPGEDRLLRLQRCRLQKDNGRQRSHDNKRSLRFRKYFNSSDDDLKRYVDQCIKGAHAVGQPYITWPWLDENSRSLDSFKSLAKKLNMMGEQIKKAGLTLAYHNHNFEFIDHDGHNGYEIVMNETDPDLVKLQIDLYWAMHSSKLTPHELFLKQPGRFVMWHIKDMDKKTRDYTELGNGSIDYTVILPDAKLAGLQYYYLEQGGKFCKRSDDEYC
ncbi:MAG: sugar phosphate isomerase/epimerase [Bacteroidota bacterium]